MDRASLVIVISFVGGAVLLVGLLWLLVRLDRSAAGAAQSTAAPVPPAPALAAPPLAEPPLAEPPLAGPPLLRVVEDPPEEPEPVTGSLAVARDPGPVAVGAPPDNSARVRVGAAAGAVALLAVLLLVVGTRRRRRPRS